MADIIFECPHCAREIEAPSDVAGQTFPCPGCAKPVTVPALSPPPKKTWRDDPATGPQLGALARYGLEPDYPITKGAASDMLTKAEADGVPQVDAMDNLRRNLAQTRSPASYSEEKKEWKAEIATLRKKLADPSLDEGIRQAKDSLRTASRSGQDTDELEDRLEMLKIDRDELLDELETAKDELESLIEEAAEAKVDLNDRIEERLEDFARAGKYSPYFKKPTKTQMRKVLTDLDDEHPDWRELGDEPILATLQSDFPELIKQPLPSQQKKVGWLQKLGLG